MLVSYTGNGLPVAVCPPVGAEFRSAQQPIIPSQGDGTYKLPREAQGHLQAALAPYRNREAAHRLAVFLGRFWTSPKRIVAAFPIDRRALSNHRHLGLTEGEVRGAINTLERIGFLDRDIVAKGSRYKATPDGLHRKPILYRFAPEYGALFIQANRRAELARQRRPALASVSSPSMTPVRGQTRPATTGSSPSLRGGASNLPKDKNCSESKVLMGYQNLRLAPAFEPMSPLERALRSLGNAIEGKTAYPTAISERGSKQAS